MISEVLGLAAAGIGAVILFLAITDWLSAWRRRDRAKRRHWR
jgi:hypothetical protein